MAETMATSDEVARWLDDARLGFVRPFRGDYVRDVTVVAKVRALCARIATLEAENAELRGDQGRRCAEGEVVRCARQVLRNMVAEDCAARGPGWWVQSVVVRDLEDAMYDLDSIVTQPPATEPAKGKEGGE